MVTGKPRKVFFSFHYQRDAWRASQVRNIGFVEGNPSASDNKWEEVKKGGDVAIQAWIDRQLAGRECTIVLVGADTARRRWVTYEIKESWNSGKGLFGIRIHRLLNQDLRQAAAGPNPFDQFTLKNGRALSSLVDLHNPPFTKSAEVYAHIADNLSDWIDRAIAKRST